MIHARSLSGPLRISRNLPSPSVMQIPFYFF
jgi:hypothetical protein